MIRMKFTEFPPLSIKGHAFGVFDVVMKGNYAHDSSGDFVGVEVVA